MFTLDHPSLELFEPKFIKLFDCAFGTALQGLASAGFRPGDEWHTEASQMFQAACLPGFKRAQCAIGLQVIEFEKRIASFKKDESVARGKCDPSSENIKNLRHILKNRQLVFRRLMDGMIWTLIWPNRWIVRRLRLEGGIRRVDPLTVQPLLDNISQRDYDSDDKISIICDLTTLAQLGDLIIAQWIPIRKSMKIVVAELKVGKKNVLLHKLLHDPQIKDENATISMILEDMGPKAAQQAKRMARQEKRLKDFTHVIATDEGIHPVTGSRFRMTKDANVSKDYRDEIWNLVSRAKKESEIGFVMEGCLRLIAFVPNAKPTSYEALEIAYMFHKMRCGDPCESSGMESLNQETLAEIASAPKAINLFEFNMTRSIALPPLLWYPRVCMLDVLAGRVKIFAQFDHNKFFEMATTLKLKMSFITGKDAARIKHSKLSGPLVEYSDDRYIKITNSENVEILTGARFFSKIYLDLIRPHDLLLMANNLVNEAASLKNTSSQN